MRTSANRMLGITVGVIAVVAVVVGIVTATHSPAQLDPKSPQGVVQTYLTAIFEHRFDDAATSLDAAGDCAVDDLDRSGFNQDARVDLLSTDISGSTARVNVRLDYSSGDPFGSGWSEDKTFRLVKTSAAWAITGIPWPMYDCGATAVK